MVTISEEKDPRSRVWFQLFLGALAGIITFYIASVASADWYRSAGIAPVGIFVALWYLPMLLIAGGSVILGWRWPTVGLAAGIVIVALVVFGLAAHMSVIGLPLSSWMDLGSVLAHGGGNVFVPVVGVVLMCSSLTGTFSHRHS